MGAEIPRRYPAREDRSFSRRVRLWVNQKRYIGQATGWRPQRLDALHFIRPPFKLFLLADYPPAVFRQLIEQLLSLSLHTIQKPPNAALEQLARPTEQRSPLMASTLQAFGIGS